MSTKIFFAVLFTVLVSAFLVADFNFNVTKAVDYSSSGTTVGGIIWENTTWTLENSPYNITDTVQIPENVTLTIEPGVTVIKSKACDMFLLHGTIYAHGTIDNKIIFDGRGYTSLIIIGNTIVSGRTSFFNAENSNSNAFLDMDYCIVKNGVSFWWGGHGSFSLKHSELSNLIYYSYLWYPYRDVIIEYNKFINTNGISIGTDGDIKVYVRHNLFKKKYATSLIESEFCIKNWASYSESETIVKYNSFIDMDGIVLELPEGYDSAAMTATENYWGTTDTEAIDSMIYDKNDDINCAGFIDYLPVLTEPHPDTPTLPLIVNFTYSPSQLYAQGAAIFNASSSFGPHSTIANYTWDFGDDNTITLNAPITTYTYMIPGNYNVTLTVTDEFGFKNSTTTSVMVLQDDIPPNTSDDYDGLWHNSDFTITLTATDIESGVTETYYRINNGPFENVSANGHPYITIESVNNTVEYWSVDNADNEELPHKVLAGVKLDKTLPKIGIPTRMPEGDVQPNQAVKVTVNVTDLTSGVESVRLAYFINNETIGLAFFMTYNATTGLYSTPFGIPGQQANTLVRYAITAYDNAGNLEVEDNTGQYYVYTVIPEFPSFLILPLFMIATLLAIIIYRRKHST